MDSKACTKCGKTKPFGDFYGKGEGRYRGDCKACVLLDRRERYASDPEMRERIKAKNASIDPAERRARYRRYRAERPDVYAATARRRHLRREYGITIEDFDAILESQSGRCAICDSGDPGKTWCVDHDHESGAIRGVLCWHCNVGLGHFRDNPTALASAIDYLATSAQSVRSVS